MIQPSRWTLPGVSTLLVLIFLLSEYLRLLSESKMVNAHQEKANCLALVSKEVYACYKELSLHPDDIDFCPEAVLACKAKGIYKLAEDSDINWIRWIHIDRIARICLFLGCIFVIGRGLARHLKRKSHH